MIQTIHCFQCGAHNTPVGVAMASVKVSAWRMCGECHKPHNKDIDLHFCTTQCMVAYMAANGESLVAKADEMAKTPDSQWPYRMSGDRMVNVLTEIPRAAPAPRPPVVAHVGSYDDSGWGE